MAKKFSNLIAKMPKQARARARARPCDGLELAKVLDVKQANVSNYYLASRRVS